MGSAEEIRAIEALIRRQFASLAWAPGRPADWEGFAADFLDGAVLVPAARPAAPRDVPSFVERMRRMAEDSLARFDERFLGAEIRVFGNIAVALAAVEIVENGTEASRNVEALLLVRTDGAWRIAGQAWDPAGPDRPVPTALRGGDAGE
jgi:hypothetical protein